MADGFQRATVHGDEQDLRALVDTIPQLAWIADASGEILWYNRGWYEYTGTTFEQMYGWGWEAVHDPEFLPIVRERWLASLRQGHSFEMEFPLRGADGNFRWFLTRVNPMRDPEGRVVRWFGTNTDVDEVKRIREALRDETRTLELLNETGASLASQLDPDVLMQSITDAATKLSGAAFGAFFYTRREEEGGEFLLYNLSGAPREAFSRFPNPRATHVFGPTFRAERTVRFEDVTRSQEYGKMAPYHGMPPGHLPVRSYLAVPVVSRSGEAIGGLFFGHPEPGVFTERHERLIEGVAGQAAIAVDNARLYEGLRRAVQQREQALTSERAARAEAERVSVMKDEFLATLSHELRTPLNAILGWCQLLRTRRRQADVERGLDVIERNARMQAQLVGDLLDMSSILSGKMRLDVQTTNLEPVLSAALESVRPSAEAKGIRLEAVMDGQAGLVSGDPARLQQIFWNLLSNAIKFTPGRGKVSALLRRTGSHLEVQIQDTGVGIAPEFLPVVFERFRQADSSTTRSYTGLGLGLSLVKHLVELHGGSVHADSAGEGLGATFAVRLPVAALEPSSSSPPDEGWASDPPDLRGLTVLVVEDEADARELLERVLSEAGATVHAASSGEEALRLVESTRPQVLVSDVGMPRMDGYELLRRIRDLGPERGGRVDAVALTALARPQDRMRALRAGFLVHLAKPVDSAELLVVLGSIAARQG